MKGQLDNMRMVSDDKKSSKSCVNTLRHYASMLLC